ncbi:SDR family NAD(P)-dependent oxidoreductase, partial [Klebsiella pneumoniae]|uniref:SDR family NAD(P)-dependent oxidoreductase n=1 Tax=Klebsiella pneumoniae TaxID=573 RepID=UPI0024DEB9CA
MNTSEKLEGTVSLITGASSGIGAATALKLAAAGSKVGIASRRADRLESLKDEIESNGGEAVVIEMDVADP